MPRKNSTTTARTMSLEDVNRSEIRRIVFDKVDMEPPVGERYEFLLRKIIDASIDEYGVKLSKADRESLADELFSYVASFGPIEEYFNDPQISEIMVNGPDQIFIERNGELILTDLKFDNNEHVRFAINHIINPMGRFITSKHPLIDSRLPDGSRVNAVIPPVSPNGSCITIRRFLKDKLTVEELIDLGSLTPQIAEFLSICVQASLNIVVAGNTSSGKTTLLNILTHQIPEWERIVTIEDSAELSLHQTHVVTLEAQPADYRGEGAVSIRDLVRNALRMRPDRIVVGEVRGGEALDMLQAMNTGHDGSLTTVHSNTPRDTISRLETMSMMSGLDMPLTAIRKQIASALNLIVQLSRFPDGSRRITNISEVVGMEGDVVTMTDIFKFQSTGVNENRRIVGEFRATGLRPSFSQALDVAGMRLDHKLFSNNL
ncbi:MAG: CpaF family protein [Anaerolineales bacterium]